MGANPASAQRRSPSQKQKALGKGNRSGGQLAGLANAVGEGGSNPWLGSLEYLRAFLSWSRKVYFNGRGEFASSPSGGILGVAQKTHAGVDPPMGFRRTIRRIDRPVNTFFQQKYEGQKGPGGELPGDNLKGEASFSSRAWEHFAGLLG